MRCCRPSDARQARGAPKPASNAVTFGWGVIVTAATVAARAVADLHATARTPGIAQVECAVPCGADLLEGGERAGELRGLPRLERRERREGERAQLVRRLVRAPPRAVHVGAELEAMRRVA